MEDCRREARGEVAEEVRCDGRGWGRVTGALAIGLMREVGDGDVGSGADAAGA